MPSINWDRLVNEGRAIGRDMPLPDHISHVSELQAEILYNDVVEDTDTVSEKTREELLAQAKENGIRIRGNPGIPKLIELIENSSQEEEKEEIKVIDPNDSDTL